MTTRFARFAVGAVLSLALSGCDEGPDGATDSAGPLPHDVNLDERSATDDREVLWQGCSSVVDYFQCERDGRPLVLWVPGSADGWRLSLNGEPLTSSTQDAWDGGVRLTVALPPTQHEEVLELYDDRGASRLRLALLPDRLSPSHYTWGEALPKERSWDPDTTPRLIEQLTRDIDAVAPLERLARLQSARSLAHDASDIPASIPREQPLLRQVVEVATQQERWGERCKAATIGLFLATFEWGERDAERWAQWEQPCRARSTMWGVAFDVYLGTLALRRGRYAEAGQRLRHARHIADRLDLVAFSLLAHRRSVELLVRTGRTAEALREIEALYARPVSPCQRATIDSVIGFLRVHTRRRGGDDLGDPRPLLEDALSLHEPQAPCKSVTRRNHDLIKLGFDANHRGDLAELRRHMAAIDPSELRGKFVGQWHELRALEAIDSQAPMRARDAIEAMKRSLSATFEPDAQWRVHMLRARLAESEHDPEGAISAYRDAEGVVGRLQEGVASGAIVDRWFSRYRDSAVALVEHLVERGRIDEAACAARSARTRALSMHDPITLRQLAANGAIDVGADSCQRPWQREPGEWVVLAFPRRSEGTWVFSVEDTKVSVLAIAALPSAPDQGTEPGFWDPWSPQLDAASQVRVLASEAGLAVPFHRLRWRDAPLISQRSVVYGLDLAAPPAVDRDTPGDAALIAFADVDPEQSLRGFYADVAEVDSVTSAAGWASEWLADDALHRDALTQHLASVDLLHYYGHGDRQALLSGGPPPEDDDVGTTALRLAGGSRLHVDDVLALPRVPRHVVLMGCQLGRPDVHGWSGGLNLAHAFLLAGTEQVLGATTPLNAKVAAKLGPKLYEHEAPRELDLGQALQRQWASHLQQYGDEPRWHDLRVWTR